MKFELVEAMGVEPMSAISRAPSPTCVSLDYSLKQKQEHLRLRAGSVYGVGYTPGKVSPTSSIWLIRVGQLIDTPTSQELRIS